LRGPATPVRTPERAFVEPKPPQPVHAPSEDTAAPPTGVTVDQLWAVVTQYAGQQHNGMSRALVESVTVTSFDGRTLRLKPPPASTASPARGRASRG
jgi:CHASE1-domain containing sensor protein